MSFAQTETRQSVLDNAVRRWADNNPRTTERLSMLLERGVRCGIFSSVLSAMVADEKGLLLPRRADDVDLLVVNEDCMLAASLLPDSEIQTDKPFHITSADGSRGFFMGHNIAAPVPDERPIQIIQPQGCYVRDTDTYLTHYTDTAFWQGSVIETHNGLVPVAPLYRALAMYALTQRGGDKFDHLNAQVISQVYDPLDPYADICRQEMRLTPRETAFIGRLVLGSEAPQPVSM